jgi:enterochelin esterase-like enzyme
VAPLELSGVHSRRFRPQIANTLEDGMPSRFTGSRLAIVFGVAGLLFSSLVHAAPAAAQRGAPTPNDTLVSNEIAADGHVTFRVYAPKAGDVVLRSDYPVDGNSADKLTKSDDGVWSVTVGPVEPGTYRYVFLIDGVATADSKNPNVITTLSTVQSIFTVPGAEFQDVKPDAPHGSVDVVWYYSSTTHKMRRAHVYTPPGYNGENRDRYPVFYMLHNTSESDDSWFAEGRANVILDNLIAAGKAKPMIFVAPAEHAGGTVAFDRLGVDAFNDDFLNDLVPYIEKNYRVIADRRHRAIAGQSMGGLYTLALSTMHLDKFSYVGVFSSGWFQGTSDQFVKQHGDQLDNAAWKKDLKLYWVGVDKDNKGIYANTQETLGVLRAHGFNPETFESAGHHNWLNWREYLILFAPKLFR